MRLAPFAAVQNGSFTLTELLVLGIVLPVAIACVVAVWWTWEACRGVAATLRRNKKDPRAK